MATAPTGTLPRRLAWALLAVMACWQVAAAATVSFEYYDGYDTIINARYLLGQAPSYIPVRFPAMAALAAPAEALRAHLGLHPLDVRLAHGASALLHILYSIGCWVLLTRCYGPSWASLLAFTAAIPTYLYFTYAPFLSHDLAPGIGLLWMLILANRQLTSPTRSRWLGLAVLGAACALVKPTFGLFWAVLLAAFALGRLSEGPPSRKAAGTRGVHLVSAAAASGLLFWSLLSWTLAETVYGEAPWWRRPWDQVSLMGGQIEDAGAPLWWLYLRNLPAFGPVAMLGIVPGLWFGLRGQQLERVAAIAWILCVAVVQLLPRHEVRYLAFLAPLTALLLVAPFQRWLARGQSASLAAGAVLALTWLPAFPYSPMRAALEPFEAADAQSGIRWLLAPLDSGTPASRLFFYANKVITFLPPGQSSLAGDPFHRMFQLGPHHPRLLLGWTTPTRVGHPEDLAKAAAFPPGSFVLSVWPPDLDESAGRRALRPPGDDAPQQWLAKAVATPLQALDRGDYATSDGHPATLGPPEPGAGPNWSLRTSWFESSQPTLRNLRLAVEPGAGGAIDSYGLTRESEQRYRVHGLTERPAGRVWLTGLRVERRLLRGRPAPSETPDEASGLPLGRSLPTRPRTSG